MRATVLKVDYVDKKSEFHLPISVFRKPKNLKEYTQFEKILDKITDVVRGNEKHPLAEVMQIIGENLEQFDDENFPPIGAHVSDIELVIFLMQSHHFRQADLADVFGGQANVSKFLNGERPLSKSQIIRLKNKFKISGDVFLR